MKQLGLIQVWWKSKLYTLGNRLFLLKLSRHVNFGVFFVFCLFCYFFVVVFGRAAQHVGS